MIRAIVLEDGRRLDIAVTQSALSDCSRNHILRFATSWPPRTPGRLRSGRIAQHGACVVA